MQTISEERCASQTADSFRLAMLIRELYALTMKSVDENLTAMGITHQQCMVIKRIAHQGSVQNSELCSYMNLTKGTVSGIMKRLESKGLVKREIIASDKRHVRYVFTVQGMAFADSFRSQLNAIFESLFQNSVPEDKQRYLFTLREMIQALVTEKENSLRQVQVISENQVSGKKSAVIH